MNLQIDDEGMIDLFQNVPLVPHVFNLFESYDIRQWQDLECPVVACHRILGQHNSPERPSSCEADQIQSVSRSNGAPPCQLKLDQENMVKCSVDPKTRPPLPIAMT